MLIPLRNIFLAFILTCYCRLVFAQQNPVQLPSLITNQEMKNSPEDDDLTIENILRHSMFVKVTASKSKVFVGEPVMAIYKFYTAVHGQAVVTKQPEFTGCGVKELNFDDDPQSEIIHGETYSSYIIRKVQLTPLRAGFLSLGEASVENYVELPNGSDPFVTNNYNISVTNPATLIQVNELPSTNKPREFYGITGIFRIAASALSNKVPVGENAHLIVTIKGAGNLDAINKPEISWPLTTDHFDGNDSQHINQDNFPISGDKTFDIPFVGRQEGTVVIPPIRFSFFNTSLKNYQTVSTDSIAITFTKALDKSSEFSDIVNYDISNRKYLWIVPAIALTVAMVGFIGYRRGRMQSVKNLATSPATISEPLVIEPPSPIQIKYRTDFSRYWSDLENISETRPFFSKAKELIGKAIAERTDTRDYAEEILLAELKQKTLNKELYQKAVSLFEACNVTLYAPFEIQADLRFYFNEVRELIEQLQAES